LEKRSGKRKGNEKLAGIICGIESIFFEEDMAVFVIEY
jgi:hypothetical protein